MHDSRSRARSIAVAWLLLAATPCAAQFCPGRAARTDVGAGSLIQDLAVAGNFLYVAGAVEGLTIWDISDPAHPTLTARWLPETWEFANWGSRVTADQRGIVYLSTPSSARLGLIAAQAPGGPVRVGELFFPFTVRSFSVGDGLLVSSSYTRNWLFVYDVSHADAPVEVSSVWLGPSFFAPVLAARGSIAYLVSWSFELRVYDLSDPVYPRPIAQLSLSGAGHHLRGSPPDSLAVDDRVLVVWAEGLAYLVDVSDPAHPFELGPVPGFWGFGTDVQLSGSLLVGHDGRALNLVDLSDPTEPILLSQTVVGRRSSLEPRVAVTGDTVVVADEYRNLTVVNITDRAAPRVVATLDSASFLYDVREDDGVAVVCECGAGVRTFDVSDPHHPRQLGLLELDGCAIQAALVGTLAFLATGSAGLSVVDLTDPARPLLLATHETVGIARSVASSGSLVAVGEEISAPDRPAGVELFDVSQPAAPVRLAWRAYAEDVANVALQGTTLLAVDGSLHVVDASNPADPVEVQVLDPTGASTLYAVWAVRDLVLVSTWQNRRTFAYDLADLSDPRLVWEEPISGWNFDLEGDTALLVGYDISAADFSNPRSPRWSTTRTDKLYYGAALVGDVAIVGQSPFLDTFTLECRAPEADFHAGQWGLVAELEDRSRYAPETVRWDLGDGTTSDRRYLIHRYARPGAYTVTLTVTNAHGTSTVSRTLDVLAERRVAGRFGR
jgi:hypothetical protein